MKYYVLGFLFDEEKERVALIRKNRPEWQNGFFNGIGGKVEVGETGKDAMIREFKEEAGLDITDWNLMCIMDNSDWICLCYCGVGDLSKVESLTDEPVSVWDIHELHELNVVSNLRWLIPMALDEGFEVPFIKYK